MTKQDMINELKKSGLNPKINAKGQIVISGNKGGK